jgi:hypothetical protein
LLIKQQLLKSTEISENSGHPTAKMGADISENSDYSVVFTKFAVSINGIINRTITHIDDETTNQL